MTGKKILPNNISNNIHDGVGLQGLGELDAEQLSSMLYRNSISCFNYYSENGFHLIVSLSIKKRKQNFNLSDMCKLTENNFTLI